MHSNNRLVFYPLMFALGLFASLVVAEGAGAQSEPRGRRKPPPEAYAACDSKKSSDACTVSIHDKTISGVCTGDESSALFCLPDRMPPPPDGKGPPGGDGAPPDGPPPDGSAR